MKTSVPGIVVLLRLLLLLLLLSMLLSRSTSCTAARPLRSEKKHGADEAIRVDTGDGETRKRHRAAALGAKEEASYPSVRQDNVDVLQGTREMEDQEEEEEEEKGCASEEEGCRRTMAEAHLDYIYTQHHPHH